MSGDVLVVRMLPPLGDLAAELDRRDEAGERERPLIERVGQAVQAGMPRVVIDLSGVGSATVDEVKVLTDFLWAIRVAGGEPVVASPVAAVSDTLRSLKLDRAFLVCGGLGEAIERV